MKKNCGTVCYNLKQTHTRFVIIMVGVWSTYPVVVMIISVLGCRYWNKQC